MAQPRREIYGIPCRVKSPKLRRVIHIVLRQIRSRAPKDFRRIRRRVCEFTSPRQEGIKAQFVPLEAGQEHLGRGVIELSEAIKHPVAIVAHELGHACVCEDDFYERIHGTEVEYFQLADEWVNELCADYYAYKWGFGRHIGQHRRVREWRHHGLAPGKIFTTGPDFAGLHSETDGLVRRYRITRNFKIVFLGSRKASRRKIQREARAFKELRRKTEARRDASSRSQSRPSLAS